MTTWDAMDDLAAICERYIAGITSGAIPNADRETLRQFQQEVAPCLSPLTLLVLVEAWQEKNPRPVAQG